MGELNIMQILIQAGALGLLTLVLIWQRQSHRENAARLDRVIDAKDSYIKELVGEVRGMCARMLRGRDQLVGELRKRPCIQDHAEHVEHEGDPR